MDDIWENVEHEPSLFVWLYFDLICHIGFIELPMLGWNWRIFHMNRLLYCYDLSPDWPENIWKIKHIKSFTKVFWTKSERIYTCDSMEMLVIKLANSRVETKILVLHFFLHSGGRGGTTNLIFHDDNNIDIWHHISWKSTLQNFHIFKRIHL